MIASGLSSDQVPPEGKGELLRMLADLAPVTKVSASPLVIVVNPNTGIGSVKELIEKAKQEPLARVVRDYIAGMTDNFIYEQYQKYVV